MLLFDVLEAFLLRVAKSALKGDAVFGRWTENLSCLERAVCSMWSKSLLSADTFCSTSSSDIGKESLSCCWLRLVWGASVTRR